MYLSIFGFQVVSGDVLLQFCPVPAQRIDPQPFRRGDDERRQPQHQSIGFPLLHRQIQSLLIEYLALDLEQGDRTSIVANEEIYPAMYRLASHEELAPVLSRNGSPTGAGVVRSPG